MKSYRAAIAAASLALLAAGCSEPGGNDPREGVVYLEKENCLTAGCFSVTKVCLGPDLIYVDTRLSDANRERVIEDAPECEPEAS